jgi:RNA polymerase sigma factor (sigma-70 family)
MCNPGVAREVSVTKVQWLRASVALRGTASPWSRPEAVTLYRLIRAEGERVLRRYRHLDRARREDIAGAVFVRALPSVVAADDPCAYARTALSHEARSWLRRRDAVVVETPADREGVSLDSARRAEARLILRRVSGRLSPREMDVFRALAEGEEREVLARRLGTSRANVDQIVHRSRARVLLAT